MYCYILFNINYSYYSFYFFNTIRLSCSSEKIGEIDRGGKKKKKYEDEFDRILMFRYLFIKAVLNENVIFTFSIAISVRLLLLF